MAEDLIPQTAALLKQDFELESLESASITEEELLQVLANQIAYMIEYQLEVLLSLMYRLDVAEKKVQAALAPGAVEPPNIALARVVLERQKRRAFTKKNYKPEQLEGWDEW